MSHQLYDGASAGGLMMIQANKVSSIPRMGESFSQGLTSKPVEGILYERRDYFCCVSSYLFSHCFLCVFDVSLRCHRARGWLPSFTLVARYFGIVCQGDHSPLHAHSLHVEPLCLAWMLTISRLAICLFMLIWHKGVPSALLERSERTWISPL